MTQRSRESIIEAGRQLRAMREDAGMSTIEMAYYLEVTERTILNWETGKTDAGKVGRIAYETMTRKRGRSLAKPTSSCNHPFGSYALRLFDPDELPAVIDLRDHIVAQMHQQSHNNGSVALYANAS